MNNSLWFTRVMRGSMAIALIVALFAFSIPAGAAPGTVQTAPSLTTQAQITALGDNNWSSLFMLGADSFIKAMVFAPNGDLYVGGAFTKIAGVNANHLARWQASLNKWSAVGSGVNAEVDTLLIFGNTLYIGGIFTQANDKIAGAIASYDISTGNWSDLAGGVSNSKTTALVSAMAVDSPGNLYAVGQFDTVEGLAAQNVAMWNGTSWSAIATGVGSSDDRLTSIALTKSTDIYVGGQVATPAGFIYHYDGTSWSALGGGTDGVVNALALSNNQLYVGGSFTSVDGGRLLVNDIALWDTGTRTWLALAGGLDAGSVSAIAFDANGNIFVAGSFASVSGITANNIALWNGTEWSALIDHLNGPAGIVGVAEALAVSGTDVYVGGQITAAGGYDARNIAHWDGADRDWLSPGNTVNGQVLALAISGNNLYVGGNFSSAGGFPARSIVLWNGISQSWHVVGSGDLAILNGPAGSAPIVRAIAINGLDVYVGGAFTSAGGLPVNNIVRLTNSSWFPMDNGVTGCSGNSCFTEVFTLAVDNAGLAVGGLFTHAGLTTVNNLARWDGNAWHAFHDTGNSFIGTNGFVYAIAPDGAGHYYIGGSFTTPGTNLVFFDGTSWSLAQSSPNAAVHTILRAGGIVYIGGEFTNAGGSNADFIAASINNADWTPLGNSLDNFVNTLSLSGNTLYAGGAFSMSGALVLNHIAAWSTTSETWSSLGSGTDNVVDSVASLGSKVFAGGLFSTAGGKPSNYLGSYQLLFNTILPIMFR